VLVILPLERDLAVFVRQQALIGDGDTMGVAAEVFDRLLRTSERRLGINNLFAVFVRLQQCRKGEGVLEWLDGTGKLKLSVVESIFQLFEKEPPEQT
jgi:hypothetical protein